MNRWKRLLTSRKAPAAVLPSEEERRLARDLAIWRGSPPWLGATGGKTLHLGRTVCREMARTVCAELAVSIEGSGWLQKQIDRFLPRFSEAVSGVCGVGQGMIRLYPDREGVHAELVLPDRYAVLERNGSGEARHVCFFEEHEQNGERFVRCEEHRLEPDGGYRIESRLYLTAGDMARQVPLGTVAKFASYPPVLTVGGMTRGFFVEWRLDAGGCFGAGKPIWGDAVSLMEDADRQYERLLWEFEGGELAVDASEDAFRLGKDGRPEIPAGKDRLFRMNGFDGSGEEGSLFRVFSPSLRDESLIRGLNRILMFFEDAVGLARGTVSDPSAAVKTATEVKVMRQRTYLSVEQIRRQGKAVLEALCEAMRQMGMLYQMCGYAAYRAQVRFGDSVLRDFESEREADRADFEAGLISREEYRRIWMKGEGEA